jgi:hypothetical protein
MTVRYSPIFNSQVVDANGNPASGWKIYTYLVGSSTPLATYTTSTGTVAQSNPIILNSLGFPTTGQIWLTDGQTYKLVLTDSNDVVKDTQDNIVGINDTSATSGEWSAFSGTPTYISATSFSVTGDQTTDLHVGRRLKFTVNAGTVYGRIRSSAFTTITTLTMVMESGTLDSGLSAFSVSILRNDNLSVPEKAHTDTDYTDIASNGTCNIFALATRKANITGTTTITALDATPFAQVGKIITGKFAGILTLTHNGTSLILPAGGANITTAAGDTFVAEALGSGNVRITDYVRASGASIVAPTVPTAAAQSDQETGTSTTLFVSPGRQQYHPSALKAWVKFKYTGGVLTVLASYNVSSVTRNGSGDYTVNFTVSFSSVDYSFSGNFTDSVGNVNRVVCPHTMNVGSFRVVMGDGAGSPTEPAVMCTLNFEGDQ